ncbi:glycosyltransferase family 2 protein [Psychroserpens sp.]|uniref:glycosyltransferase family 2 protein n=1 Tax=Psychroserpens sp. TaxID=2020870 RepID=UPI001B0B29AD|nr:glycosyltransferase family 2 protein [Psychroserpens sp.]MBO6607448.1 glycosyltransferase family 2 protein [Psychroserpens sp.]MBO6631773.1 glycosyltransferase family 2 protein [Psychroserpens sp.]MBO6654474.1 glycosyltransferase family 2 protein [Psychroserpens sp.]MBO6681177.1 glycosyltransferase family 2 protein [Psychroserpens sp.]MBO6749866.1 glycosyltransferase family 2 protein [Psychroserpens sp.]
MKIAVVILNWNGKTLLERFLPSVVKHSSDADIYVADNASTDDSISFLNSKYPEIQIIQNNVNGGYAKGYNDALKHVNADIYCLLNSDIEVSEGWLSPIINEFETHTDTTIIQPKIVDQKNKTYFEYAGAGGGFIDKYGFPYCRGRVFDHIEKDNGQYNDTIPIFWASGACLFIRSEAFKFLNGFDESYFAHFEEIDLCWRAFNYGFTTKYVGTSTVYHVGGATLNSGSPRKTYLNFRNSLFTITKNLPSPIIGTLFIRMLLDGIAGLKFLLSFKGNHFLAILKAHFSFYGQLSKLFKARRNIPQQKKYYNERSIVWSYFVRKRYRS